MKKGEFVRTSNRRDYALPPTGRTVLERTKGCRDDVIAIGKIKDIFDGAGITESLYLVSSVKWNGTDN